MRCRHRFVVTFVTTLLFSSCDQSPTPAPTLPASSATVSPSPPGAATVALPACGHEDLIAAFDGFGAAAGSYGGRFRLAPTATECVLPARPAIRLVDANGVALPVIHEHHPIGEFVPVRGAASGVATFLHLLWSNHGGEPEYHCAQRTAAASVDLELTASRIAFDFPQNSRPLLCSDPPERIFVQVIAR